MDSIRVRSLDHVVLRVADLARSIRFYADVFGCEVERRLDELGLVQLRAGAGLIDLVDIASPIGRAGGGPVAVDGHNVDHFALALESFDEQAIRAHLERLGIEASETGRRYGAAGFGPSVYLRDPDGNTVELKGPPEAGAGGRTRGEHAQADGAGSQDDPAALERDRVGNEVLAVVREIERAGLVEGTAGNVSARTATGEIVLTPTATPYSTMRVEDLAITRPTGEQLAGDRPPTTEIGLHLACLQRYPEIGAVVHTHALHASIFAVLQAPIPCVLEEFEYYVGGDVLVAPYHATGSETLGPAVADLLGDRAAALVANHGLVVVGATPGEALALTKLVERAARIVWGARAIGEPVALPEATRADFAAAYRARRQASAASSAERSVG